VKLLAGSPGFPGWKDAKGDNAHFRNPWSVAVDKSGNVFVADMDNSVIRQITPEGRVTTLAGKAGAPGFIDGKRETARFKSPHGIATDDVGNIYVTDPGNQAVRRIAASGEVTTIARALSNPESMAVDALGAVYFTDSLGIHKMANGKTELLPPFLLTSSLDGPVAEASAIAVDRRGVMYIVDTTKNIVCWQAAK
jgi:streptogramin lyase